MHAPTKQYNEEGKENVRRKRPRSVDETFSPKVIRTPTAEPPHKRPKRAAAGRIKNYADTYGDLRSPVNSVPLKQEYPSPVALTAPFNNFPTPKTKTRPPKKSPDSSTLKEKRRKPIVKKEMSPIANPQSTPLVAISTIKKEPDCIKVDHIYIFY